MIRRLGRCILRSLRLVVPGRAAAAQQQRQKDDKTGKKEYPTNRCTSRITVSYVDTVYTVTITDTVSAVKRFWNIFLHTLVVDPAAKGRGCGTEFVNFYEEMGKATARPFLRMDTNEKNRAARALYHKLGYREAGIVPCEFNGICGVGLVCLEKTLD